MAQLTIDGKTYEMDNVSETARQQLLNLRACDEETRQLQTRLAIAQTARLAYLAALRAEVQAQDEKS